MANEDQHKHTIANEDQWGLTAASTSQQKAIQESGMFLFSLFLHLLLIFLIYYCLSGQCRPIKVANESQQRPYEKPMQAYKQPAQANDKLYDDRDGLNYLYIFNCY